MSRETEIACRTVDLDDLEQVNAQLEQAIAAANEQVVAAAVAHSELRQVFNASSDGIWVVDNKFQVLRINRVQQRLVGLSEGEAIGRKCFELFPCALCTGDECSLKQVRRGKERSETDIEVDGIEGGTDHYICTATPYRDLSGGLSGVVESFKNITDRKRMEIELEAANAELNRQAYRDSLTGLANRRMFTEYADREWKRLARDRQPMSVIMCDIDYFKRYNDTYGHQAGDTCLEDVADAIRGAVLRPADLVARYGGEEFIVLLPDTESAGALEVAERIRVVVRGRGIVHGESLVDDCVTISVGVSGVQPRGGLTWEALVQEADLALYEAKELGRNRVAVSLLDEQV